MRCAFLSAKQVGKSGKGYGRDRRDIDRTGYRSDASPLGRYANLPRPTNQDGLIDLSIRRIPKTLRKRDAQSTGVSGDGGPSGRSMRLAAIRAARLVAGMAREFL
jgi:hypothetical protein